MSIQTHVYQGDDSGGPIDWSSPVATVAGTAYTVSDLPAGSRRRVGIRLFDMASGLEEAGSAAQILLARDAAGADVSTMPGGPRALSVVPKGGPAVSVSWLYLPVPGRPDPTEFALWCQVGSTVDPTIDPDLIVNALDIAATPDGSRYRASIGGLSAGVGYMVLIRGRLGAADDGNMLLASFTAAGSLPRAVEGAMSAATFKEGVGP